MFLGCTVVSTVTRLRSRVRSALAACATRSGSSASCGVNFAPCTGYTLAAGRGDGSVLSASLCSTWMFLPQVGLGAALIDRMRALRDR